MVVAIHALLTTPLIGLIQTQSEESIINSCCRLLKLLDASLFSLNPNAPTVPSKRQLAEHIGASWCQSVVRRPLGAIIDAIITNIFQFILCSPSASVNSNLLNLIWTQTHHHQDSSLRLQSFLLAVTLKLFYVSSDPFFVFFPFDKTSDKLLPLYSIEGSLAPPQQLYSCFICSSSGYYLDRLCLIKVTTLRCLFKLSCIYGSIYIDRFLPLLSNIMTTSNSATSDLSSNDLRSPCIVVHSLAMSLVGISGVEKFLVPVRRS